MTNRDFYLAILDLTRRHEGASLALDDFLLRLLMLSCRLARRNALSADEVLQMLAGAYDDMPAYAEPPELSQRAEGFSDWEREISRHIDDLREMRKGGAPADADLYFTGWTSLTGVVWYNFTIAAYLEAGAVGTFGGWEPGDPCSRALVDGMVAVEMNGQVQFEPAEQVERPIFDLPPLSWDMLVDFLWNAQSYE